MGDATLIGAERPPAESYDVALLDLDGVVYIGPDAVPHAADALDRARAEGLTLRFVTNNASRPAATVAAHLVELGVPTTEEEVVTSAMAAASLLAGRLQAGAAVLVVGGEGLIWALEQAGLRPVRSMDDEPVAVVQGFSPDLGWRNLAEGTRAVRSGLPWIATNTDLTVPTPYGPAPGNGTLVHAVRVASGVEPEVAGKPRPALFRTAVEAAGATRPLVVGDRLDTDLEGARAAGIDGLLVLTGVCTARTVLGAGPHERPHLIGRDLRSLFEPHPCPQRSPQGGSDEPGSWTCGAATATVRDGVLVAGDDGDPGPDLDPVDLLRAGCAAAWEAADLGRPAEDLDGFLASLQGLPGAEPWAR